MSLAPILIRYMDIRVYCTGSLVDQITAAYNGLITTWLILPGIYLPLSESLFLHQISCGGAHQPVKMAKYILHHKPLCIRTRFDPICIVVEYSIMHLKVICHII